MSFFKKHQCKIAASFSHPWLFVSSTAGREGQCCLSYVWATGKQRLSTLEKTEDRAVKETRQPQNLHAFHGASEEYEGICIFDLNGQNLFAIGRRQGIHWTQLFKLFILARTVLPAASLQSIQNLDEDLLPPSKYIIMWLWALVKAQVYFALHRLSV